MNKPDTPPTNTSPEFGVGLELCSILVVDDEPGMRNFLTKILGPRCKRVEQAADVEEASKLLDNNHYDIVILDNILPGKSGLEWLREQRQVGFFADAILITAFADLETAIQALRAGAVDFVLKPFRSNQILNAVARSMDRLHLQRENYLLKYELSADATAGRGRLLGNSKEIVDIRETLQRVAPLPTPVLFTGDTGTGKEIAARTLHAMSDRADKPFVPVNCASFSPEVIANELFGNVQNDPSQAHGRQDGLLLYASGGTLFFDEIAEMPLSLQATLLRVIEEMRIRPFGSQREVPLNLRFIFATNADLPAAVEQGKFREDLYHRINVLNVRMPTLRERISDLPELAAMFMKKLSHELRVPPLPLTEQVLLKLSCYDWPGNVRELRNLIERSLILGEFPQEFSCGDEDDTDAAPDSLQAVERRHILTVLDACGGNRAEAARRLGVSRKTIDRKCAMWDV
ncbi:sigma-54-dependent transcriptional regulator [Profundibacter amoris]|uniref:Nif-specific regulatory protein n=1 Tax=Profundibacter amoris TaxID=2171755 RepID=A0A347UK37_9RHOB|nr:sigma-54 dependent transcriptional regulator [Profundibacter amoris]AXX99215.1 sigma-54-dependent Fis family transcriptional regulator [Profundibacter amoris]